MTQFLQVISVKCITFSSKTFLTVLFDCEAITSHSMPLEFFFFLIATACFWNRLCANKLWMCILVEKCCIFQIISMPRKQSLDIPCFPTPTKVIAEFSKTSRWCGCVREDFAYVLRQIFFLLHLFSCTIFFSFSTAQILV